MPEVIVAGSINMDIVATASHHPRPGETVSGTDLRFFPGGKGANQATAAARAGASATMLGAVGDDVFAPDLLASLSSAGVDVRSVAERASIPTGTALVVVDAAGENTIVVVPGANATVDETLVASPGASHGDVLVAQYEIPMGTVHAFFREGRANGATCILNPAPASPTPAELLGLVDVLVLNETELTMLSGASVAPDSSEDEIVAAARGVQDDGLDGVVVTTLGPRGVLAVCGDRVMSIAGHNVAAVDTTGAGDCFVGSLAADLAGGSTIDQALGFANAAAALCVTQAGAAPSLPRRDDVEQFRDNG